MYQKWLFLLKTVKTVCLLCGKKSRQNLQAAALLRFQSLKSPHATAHLGQPRQANVCTPTHFFTDKPVNSCYLLKTLVIYILAVENDYKKWPKRTVFRIYFFTYLIIKWQMPLFPMTKKNMIHIKKIPSIQL